MKKQLLLHKFGVKFSFYEGCTDYLTVLAKNEKQAAAKAKKWLEKNMLYWRLGYRRNSNELLILTNYGF